MREPWGAGEQGELDEHLSDWTKWSAEPMGSPVLPMANIRLVGWLVGVVPKLHQIFNFFLSLERLACETTGAE